MIVLGFLLGLALALAACRPSAGFDAQGVYRDARMKLKRGEVVMASEETERGLQHFPSEQSEWHWRFRVLKGEALARQGQSSECLKLLTPEPPAFLAATDIAVRRKLVQGVASARLQRIAEGQGFVAESESLARTVHPELLGEVLSAKAVINFLAGEIAESENAYKQSLELARKQRDSFLEAAALGGLGLIATKKERYAESIDLDRAAVGLAESVGAQNTLSTVLGNIAWCYKKLGDFENALAFYQRAVQVSVQNGQLGLQIYWLTGISNVYYEQHDYAAAETVLLQGLDLARSRGDNRTLVEYLNALAEIALQTARIEVAEKYVGEAFCIEQASPGQSGLDESEVLGSALIRARIDEGKQDYAKAEQSLRGIIGKREADTSRKWEAEARLARVYADQGKNDIAEKEFRHSLATIEGVRSSVQAEDLRLSFLSSAISFYDDYVGFLISRHRAEDALQVAELSRARTLAEGLGTAQRTKSVLLFYWLGQKQSYLWVITPAKVSCLTLAGATELDPLVKSYREAVLGGRDVLVGGNSEGEKLYTLLIEPAKKFIPQGSRVILLPDGSLYGLNFETLLVPGSKPHFWIEDVTLSTASSLTLLGSGTHSAPKDRNLLLVGNAVSTSNDFPVLRQAAAEMDRVGRYFGDSRREVLAGPQATPAAFLQRRPERFAYLHFVTHGSASRAHPLDSAVILSPDGDSFKLYARDIVKHPLSAYLVTVSACNGSGTRAYSGEGLVGLSWAFLRAGAHNVIAALWEVNDASTPQLMDKLYAELSQGWDPATALRAAKLSLLRSDTVFSKPFYWAPFQLYSGS